MKKVKFVLNTGFAGAVHEDVVEFEDDVTENDLWNYYNDWKDEQVEGYWEEVEDE